MKHFMLYKITFCKCLFQALVKVHFLHRRLDGVQGSGITVGRIGVFNRLRRLRRVRDRLLQALV